MNILVTKIQIHWVWLSYSHLSSLLLSLLDLIKMFNCFACPTQVWNTASTLKPTGFRQTANNQWTISGCCLYSRVTVFKICCQAGPDKALKSNLCCPSGLRDAVVISTKSISEQHRILSWSPDLVSEESSCQTLLSSQEKAVYNNDNNIMPSEGKIPAMSERPQKKTPEAKGTQAYTIP